MVDDDGTVVDDDGTVVVDDDGMVVVDDDGILVPLVVSNELEVYLLVADAVLAGVLILVVDNCILSLVGISITSGKPIVTLVVVQLEYMI